MSSRVFLFLLALMVFFTASCDLTDSEDEPEPGETTKYTLAVEVDEGLWGVPDAGTRVYHQVDTVIYYYSLKTGYSELSVTLDGAAVPDSGSFVVDRDRTLRATCNGRVIWKRSLPKEVYYCAPAVGDDGTIYVSTGIYMHTDWGSLYAVSPAGSVLWHYDLDYNAYSPVVGPDGTIYIQDSRNVCYALTPGGGLKWRFDDFDRPMHVFYDVGQRVPAVAANGIVYVPADGLYAVDPDLGKRLWRFNPINQHCRQSPVIAADGTIYIFLHQHDFYAVYPDNTQKWHTQLDHDWEMSFACPAIDQSGVIYVGAEGYDSSWVYSFSPADGSKRWRYPVEGLYRHVRASPAIGSDGTIYIATKAGGSAPNYTARILALTPSGIRLWAYTVENVHGPGTADDVYSTPSIGADGKIYFGAETGYFYALRTDGTLAWKTQIEHGINWSSAAITSDGTVYIGSHHANPGYHGNLYALRTTSMGYAPSPWPRFRHNNKNTGRYGGP